MYTVRVADLSSLLSIDGAPGFLPPLKTTGARSSASNPESDLNAALRFPRGPCSFKSSLFPPKEVVARYPRPAEQEPDEVAPSGSSPSRLVNVRACELRAMTYLDRVFGHEPVGDPFYQKRRQAHVVISVDCAEPHPTCFCTLVDGKPYAEEGFDVNLTPIEGAYVVEAGSPAGEALLETRRQILREATEADVAARRAVREQAIERLRAINAAHADAAPFGPMNGDFDAHAGVTRFGATCVECGACTQICPTCHCFYLVDHQTDKDRFHRLRAWDSCMWKGYSQMAGGERMKPNPRSQFRTRFANRFQHKYVWSPQQWDMLGCVGCGRCVEACPGRIDIREVLGEVSAWSR